MAKKMSSVIPGPYVSTHLQDDRVTTRRRSRSRTTARVEEMPPLRRFDDDPVDPGFEGRVQLKTLGVSVLEDWADHD
jgi:hypothetical protein